MGQAILIGVVAGLTQVLGTPTIKCISFGIETWVYERRQREADLQFYGKTQSLHGIYHHLRHAFGMWGRL